MFCVNISLIIFIQLRHEIENKTWSWVHHHVSRLQYRDTLAWLIQTIGNISASESYISDAAVGVHRYLTGWHIQFVHSLLSMRFRILITEFETQIQPYEPISLTLSTWGLLPICQSSYSFPSYLSSQMVEFGSSLVLTTSVSTSIDGYRSFWRSF